MSTDIIKDLSEQVSTIINFIDENDKSSVKSLLTKLHNANIGVVERADSIHKLKNIIQNAKRFHISGVIVEQIKPTDSNCADEDAKIRDLTKQILKPSYIGCKSKP